jgi:hypothetical protein
LPKRPDWVSHGSMNEAASIANSTKGTWENVPGILDWLRAHRDLDGKKPDDEGCLLFKLLQKGKVIVQLSNNNGQRMELTTKVDAMSGMALDYFRLPSGMKEHNPSKIVAFRTDGDGDTDNFLNNFASFPYSDVVAIPFWRTLETSEAFGRDDGEKDCDVCYEPATMKCSACTVVWFCGKVCQKKDWKGHTSYSFGSSHKIMCKRFVKT